MNKKEKRQQKIKPKDLTTMDTSIPVTCALKGTFLCTDDTCDGYHRLCDTWWKHSTR